MKKVFALLVLYGFSSVCAWAASAAETPAERDSPGDRLALLLLIGAFFFYRYKTRDKRAEKKRKALWASENALPDVASALHVIAESIDIFRTTKIMSTATSRYNIAVDRLQDLLARYPYRTDWRELLEALRAEGQERLYAQLTAEIDKQVQKSAIARGQAGKMTPLTKALQLIHDAEDSADFDEDWLAYKREEVERLIHATELGALMETAARFEFKEDWKKAVSAYQDALFAHNMYFLKRNDTPKGEQEALIRTLENKIAELKNR